MMIYCTKNELSEMIDNCRTGECENCVFRRICIGNTTLIDFVMGVDCSKENNQ